MDWEEEFEGKFTLDYWNEYLVYKFGKENFSYFVIDTAKDSNGATVLYHIRVGLTIPGQNIYCHDFRKHIIEQFQAYKGKTSSGWWCTHFVLTNFDEAMDLVVALKEYLSFFYDEMLPDYYKE